MPTGASEKSVQMGEWATSARPGEVLTCIGLGSCIALVLADLDRGVVGMAHVVLPEGSGNPPAKYGDTVVPELIERTLATGANRVALRAALVGGAAMFAFGGAPEEQIGARNEHNVRLGLALARIPVINAVTGGSTGRTLRVTIGTPVLATVRDRTAVHTPLALEDEITVRTGLFVVGQSRAPNTNRSVKQTTKEVAN